MSQEDIQLLKAEIQTLQTENRQLKEALKHAEASQAPSLVARLQEEIQELHNQLIEYKSEVNTGDKPKTKLGEIKPTILELETQIARLKDRNESLLLNLSPDHDPTSQLIQDLGSRVLNIHEEMKTMARNYRKQIQEATKKIRASQEAERTIEGLVQTLEKQTAKLNLEKKELRKHIEDSENAYAGIVTKLEKQLKDAKNAIEHAQKEAGQVYEARLKILEEKLGNEQKEKLQAEEKITALHRQLAESAEDGEELSKKLYDLRMQHAEFHQEKEELKEQHKELLDEIEELKAKLETQKKNEAKVIHTPPSQKISQEEDPFRSLNIFEI